jgi:hypothetical protein
LICYYSPFFSAAFNGNFIEGTTQSMTLDVDKVAFGVFANWFYSQVVVTDTGGRPYLVTLARVWIMAENFLIPELQNQVMGAIHASLSPKSWVPSWFTDFACIAHGHGNGENPMVEIAVWVLRWCSEKDFSYHVARIPHGILVKVAQHLKKVANPDVKELTARKASEFYVSTRQEASSSHTWSFSGTCDGHMVVD